MAEFYSFPSPEAKDIIKGAISLYAHDLMGQKEMNEVIAGLMRFYKISHLNCGTFEVRYQGDFNTPKGAFPVVVIVAKVESKNGRCPLCDSEPGTWVRGDDMLTLFCVKCGAVYKCKANLVKEV